MTTYRPRDEPWHTQVTLINGHCTCAPAWANRGMVDDRCSYHRIIDAIEDVVDAGWQVYVPTAPPHKAAQPMFARITRDTT